MESSSFILRFTVLPFPAEREGKVKPHVWRSERRKPH